MFLIALRLRFSILIVYEYFIEVKLYIVFYPLLVWLALAFDVPLPLGLGEIVYEKETMNDKDPQ